MDLQFNILRRNLSVQNAKQYVVSNKLSRTFAFYRFKCFFYFSSILNADLMLHYTFLHFCHQIINILQLRKY